MEETLTCCKQTKLHWVQCVPSDLPCKQKLLQGLLLEYENYQDNKKTKYF